MVFVAKKKSAQRSDESSSESSGRMQGGIRPKVEPGALCVAFGEIHTLRTLRDMDREALQRHLLDEEIQIANDAVRLCEDMQRLATSCQSHKSSDGSSFDAIGAQAQWIDALGRTSNLERRMSTLVSAIGKFSLVLEECERQVGCAQTMKLLGTFAQDSVVRQALLLLRQGQNQSLPGVVLPMSKRSATEAHDGPPRKQQRSIPFVEDRDVGRRPEESCDDLDMTIQDFARMHGSDGSRQDDGSDVDGKGMERRIMSQLKVALKTPSPTIAATASVKQQRPTPTQSKPCDRQKSKIVSLADRKKWMRQQAQTWSSQEITQKNA